MVRSDAVTRTEKTSGGHACDKDGGFKNRCLLTPNQESRTFLSSGYPSNVHRTRARVDGSLRVCDFKCIRWTRGRETSCCDRFPDRHLIPDVSRLGYS
jgi:hypothetical protein